MAFEIVPPSATEEQLREALFYDSETGIFIWKLRPRSHFRLEKTQKAMNKTHAGRVAGRDNHGYKNIRVFNKEYRAHRVAWLFVYGEWPKGEIDHINGDRSDNRISNLRDASRTENRRNSFMQKHNTSGINGVSWHKGDKRWRAFIKVNGKQKHIGNFANMEDAIRARRKYSDEHGFTLRHGEAKASHILMADIFGK